MRDLLLAELRRFRTWAVMAAVVNGLALAFLTRMVDMAQQPWEVYLVLASVYAVAGLLLGLYQAGSYRRPNAWLNLLHRPLAPWRIALALVAAAAALLAIAVLLPLLLTAAAQAGMTERVLDTRHLWLCLAAWNIAFAGYLTGAAAMLLPRRAALAPLVFLALLPGADATGLGAIALQVLVLAWLLALMLAAFRPDLGTGPRGAAAVLVALPMQVAMWLLLVLAGFGAEVLWILEGTHPNNLATPVAGSAKEADNADGIALLAGALAASNDARAPLWREQALISDIASTGPMLLTLPVTGELTNHAPMEFDDDERRLRYVFSHDDGLFHGYRLVERTAVPPLGIGADHTPFPAPPLPLSDDLLMAGGHVYQYDAGSARLLPRVALADGERITGVSPFGERLLVLGERHLHVFDARPLALDDAPLPALASLPLPGPVGNLQRVDVMELVDGWLVALTVDRGRHNGDGPSYQAVLRVGEDGVVEPVARRELSTGYGALYTWQTWILSPAIHQGLRVLRGVFAPDQPVRHIAPPERPRSVHVAAGLLMALSLLLALWRVRATPLPTAGRVAWIASAALIGLPALMALWLLVPPRERLVDAPLPAPAAA